MSYSLSKRNKIELILQVITLYQQMVNPDIFYKKVIMLLPHSTQFLLSIRKTLSTPKRYVSCPRLSRWNVCCASCPSASSQSAQGPRNASRHRSGVNIPWPSAYCLLPQLPAALQRWVRRRRVGRPAVPVPSRSLQGQGLPNRVITAIRPSSGPGEQTQR